MATICAVVTIFHNLAQGSQIQYKDREVESSGKADARVGKSEVHSLV